MRCSQCSCHTDKLYPGLGTTDLRVLPKEPQLQHTINKSTPSCDQRIPISCRCQAVAKLLADCEQFFSPIYLRLAQIWSSGKEETGRSGLLPRASWYIHHHAAFCPLPILNCTISHCEPQPNHSTLNYNSELHNQQSWLQILGAPLHIINHNLCCQLYEEAHPLR